MSRRSAISPTRRTCPQHLLAQFAIQTSRLTTSKGVLITVLLDSKPTFAFQV